MSVIGKGKRRHTVLLVDARLVNELRLYHKRIGLAFGLKGDDALEGRR